MTVQNRLTIAVAILSVLALTVVGLVLYTVEANNVEGRNSASMTQEIAEMRSFAQNGVDPETGERFTSVDQILTQFLAQNRPGTRTKPSSPSSPMVASSTKETRTPR